ncbi:extracellular solute-binding protein [Rathayibacter festucae]|uniref:extracellular solute-binding protein n=1 Tax=Rathayibacter festucae TaxID=110937 RepID=UPI001FB3FD6A|nr:extracellular solute-binding protein [Rathayibacter festucae]MCJ1701761.1 extracellular solute-binding protein [Rathayibacter festucae]
MVWKNVVGKYASVRRRAVALGALGVAGVLLLTSCTTSDGGPDGAREEGRTLTVWSMDGDYSPETLAAVEERFTKATGAEVDVQVQTWEGIATKVSTALATDSPPDVLDIGNTQVAGYAANGGLLDLTEHRDELAQGQTWLDGLVDPATFDGHLFAVPGFAGARAVVYSKKLWAEAGVMTLPTSYQELTVALDKVKAAHTGTPDFSAFYLPGQYWYAGLQFVWDAGGRIATQDGDTWWSALSSRASRSGLEAFKEFQNAYSSASSATLNTLDPDQNQIFADGKTSAILTTGVAGVLKANPELSEDELGTFPMPGVDGGTQPVVLGGSNWAVAAKSRNADLARQWIAVATSPEVQRDFVHGVDGWIPNSREGIEAAQSDLSEIERAFFTAALTSESVPANPNWAAIESNREIESLFSSIASGAKSVQEASEEFDAAADDTLNGH